MNSSPPIAAHPFRSPVTKRIYERTLNCETVHYNKSLYTLNINSTSGICINVLSMYADEIYYYYYHHHKCRLVKVCRWLACCWVYARNESGWYLRNTGQTLLYIASDVRKIAPGLHVRIVEWNSAFRRKPATFDRGVFIILYYRLL